VNASQTRAIQFSQNVSQVFLGINMKCASATTASPTSGSSRTPTAWPRSTPIKPLELYRCDKPTGQKAVAAWIYPELGEIDPEAPRAKRLEQLAGLITHEENGRTARTIVNRLWARLMGRGVVHPVDAMNTEPWSEEVLDLLANHLVSSGYDLKAVLRLIATSRTYQSESVVRPEERGTFVFRGPVRKRLTAEQFLDAIRTVTASWPKPDGRAFKGGAQGGQLKAVMQAHGLKEWGRPPDSHRLRPAKRPAGRARPPEP
jgi:hypothetical protein